MLPDYNQKEEQWEIAGYCKHCWAVIWEMDGKFITECKCPETVEGAERENDERESR